MNRSNVKTNAAYVCVLTVIVCVSGRGENSALYNFSSAIMTKLTFIVAEFILDPKVKDPLSPWQPVSRDGQPVLHYILGHWCLDNQKDLSNDKLLKCLKELAELAQLKQASVSTKQVHFLVHHR